MADIKVRIEGLDKVMSKLGALKGGLVRTLEEGMREAAFLVERAGKKQITMGPNRAIKTGFLRASIGVQSVMPYRATVIAGAYYGVYVHEGTRYMRARPFLTAGLRDSLTAIEDIFGKRINSLIETA